MLLADVNAYEAADPIRLVFLWTLLVPTVSADVSILSGLIVTLAEFCISLSFRLGMIVV